MAMLWRMGKSRGKNGSGETGMCCGKNLRLCGGAVKRLNSISSVCSKQLLRTLFEKYYEVWAGLTGGKHPV